MKENKSTNELGYPLFVGDYVLKTTVHNHYQGQEIFSSELLITKIFANGIEVARLKRHIEEEWLDNYPEDVTVYDGIEIVNPIKWSVDYHLTYEVDPLRRNEEPYIVEYDEVIPYEYFVELGEKIKKSDRRPYYFNMQVNGTKYSKEFKKES